MLELRNIVKKYKTGDSEIEVLKSVNIAFRKSEFVSILGASGSGKTTMLNIIGGLDKYSLGDMLVSGKSTKDFNDRDWDSYRNGTIGFVFQSYNLISHLSVLENVKLALSISGISSSTADAKAKKALQDVGLASHLHKKPGQLSGGQMQRVAIARALVTDPKIILADEPTGALDSKTSVQIMELIKEISKDKLVIMVTHNPELAKRYSDRIVRVSDGEIIQDTKEYKVDESDLMDYNPKKTAMSFAASTKSSFKNLMTKKVRTLMTTIAGSIGIISIGLVLSISAGMNKYINQIQEQQLSSVPITISANQVNFGIEEEENSEQNNGDKLVSRSRSDIHKNLYSQDALGNGETFIKYIENNAKNYYSNINFEKWYSVKALVKNSKNEVINMKADANPYSRSNIFGEMPQDQSILLNQYEVVKSLDGNFTYAQKQEEAVLFIGKNNAIDKGVLKALGYDDNTEVKYDNILGKEFSIVDNNTFYEEKNGRYFPATIDSKMYDKGTKVKIVAIMKAKDSFTNPSYGIGYTKALADSFLAKDKESKIVKAQEKSKDKNVITNEKMTEQSYEEFISSIGGENSPSNIMIYPKSFSDRDKIAEVISDYNKKIADKYGKDSADYNKYSITYSDMAKQMTSILSQMINTITLILTAFAAISLIVSSIMIGILTYVSVVERTKEIGILRAIGARKKDVTRIFRAEAGLIGLTSGVLGVAVTLGLSVPMGKQIAKALQIDGFNATLSLGAASGLIALSIFLTLFASIIPARMAAKKDPVEALRTE